MKNAISPIKFHRPVNLFKQVKRQHLIQRMNEGIENNHVLTLVSAPAGFGKTTCVNAWLSQVRIPVVWLSLDLADDDPRRFFAYFTAAVQQMDASFGKEIEGILTMEQLLPVNSIATALVSDILKMDQGFVIVLDDFQSIQDSIILQVLERIIATNLPQLHLVLVTREDPLLPLARLRANNLLTEVRSSDLRFSSAEISQFFEEVMELPLSEEDILVLEDRTEGWAAGLQLAGLSLRGRKDPSSFIASLSGSHRHIVSYLTEEVLSRQSEDIQSFLLQTSILDKLNGDLCDVVTGRTDSNWILERLLHANLFLIPLDDEQHWYRYHHLFADLLRTMLNRSSSETVKTLHQRASRWYAGAGMDFEAIEHAFAAEDFQQAVDLIEEHAMSVVMLGYVKTVERWFESIPAEWHRKSPRTSLALAGMYLLRGNYGLVDKYLKQSEPILFSDEQSNRPIPSDRKSLRSEWFAIKSNLLNVQGNAGESIAMAQQALQNAQLDDYYILGIANLGLGGGYRILDNYPGLVDAYQKSIYNSRIAGKPLSEMLSTTALALAAIRHGELHFAEEVAGQVVQRIDASHDFPPPVAGSIYGTLGSIYFEWNQLDKARRLYQQALELSQVGGHNAGVVFALVLQSRLNLAEGDLSAATSNILKAADLLPKGIPAWLRPEFIAQLVRADLAHGNLISVKNLLDDLGINWQDCVTTSNELYYLSYLRWLVSEAHENGGDEGLSQGEKIADRLIDSAREGGRLNILLPALLLRAQIYVGLGDRVSALRDTVDALDQAASEGYVRSFLDHGSDLAPLIRDSLAQIQNRDYGRYLLEVMSSATTGNETIVPASQSIVDTLPLHVDQPASMETLTEREMDVLRLIADGLKYEQIAEKLVISVNTVRFYVKGIYSKLQVNNRTQAVMVAHQLGLL